MSVWSIEASAIREAELSNSLTQLQGDVTSMERQWKDAQAAHAQQATGMQSRLAAEAGKTEELSAKVSSLLHVQGFCQVVRLSFLVTECHFENICAADTYAPASQCSPHQQSLIINQSCNKGFSATC